MAPIHDLINANDSTNTADTTSTSASSTTGHTLRSTGSSGSTAQSSVAEMFPALDSTELTRLMMQALSDLGFEKSAAALKEESGLELDSPVINSFIAYIKEGRLQTAEQSIEKLHLVDDSEAVKKRIRFLIKRQRFLEYLYVDEDTASALKLIRNEINEVSTQHNIRSLTALLMDKSSTSLQKTNGWLGSVQVSRDHLLNEISKYINPNEMIPKYRLFKLLEQSINYQKSLNLYQFGDEGDKFSLYEDVKSDKTNFPDTITKVLSYHTDEVWYVVFSHDGTKLATTSADHTVIIYDVENDFEVLHRLSGHDKQVMYASFSPDDTKLLSCSIESNAILWDVESGAIRRSISLSDDARIWCGDWYPNGECFVLGSPDKEIGLFDSETGEQLHKWEGSITNDLKITSNYKLIAVTYEKNVEVYDLVSKDKIKTLQLKEKITSISVSTHFPNQILLNVSPNELQLWDWNRQILLAKFIGHKQEKFILRSCFGADENLVCSGSEDGRVFIWNREFGPLLGAFNAHKGNANCVCWNPKNRGMFATSGDDSLVKIWGPSKKN